METLFDYAEAVKRRDDALVRVLTNESEDWHHTALMAIRRLPVGWKGIGEDIRKHVQDCGVSAPHHHNCWGALIMAAHRLGLIKRTDGWRNMRTKKSHARSSPELERI